MIDWRGTGLRWVIRPAIFVLPLPFVAGWLDLQPNWQMLVWTFFCIVWSEMTDRIGQRPEHETADLPMIRPPPLTPAQVAEAARALPGRRASGERPV